MVGRLFKRLLTFDEGQSADHSSDRITALQVPPPPHSVGGPLARRTQEGSQLKTLLEQEVHASIEALQRAFAPDGRTTDSQLLVENLSESMTGLVRQPPVAAQRALALTRDTDTSVSKLVALVERDPTLGQALLRYANSAYYATDGGPCTSFAAAIQRVGMGGVHNVVLGALLNVLMCRPGGAYQVLAEKSWSHMVRTAPIARAFAPAFDVNTDEAYAIGLLHDAGKLVIFDRLGSLRTHLRRDLAIPYTSLAALLRMLHEDLGALAALQWGLGANIARAIAAHHRAPVPQVQDSLSEVLYLAERCDISVQHRRPIDLESLWRDGELTGSRLMVEEILASPSGDVIMPAVISEDSSMKMPTSSTGGLPSGPRS